MFNLDGTLDLTKLDPSVADCLARSALFEKMAPDDRSSIFQMMKPQQFRTGQFIFRLGDAPDGLYLLQSGGVGLTFTTTDGREITHSYATVGAVFGEVATLDGGTRSADAAALTDVDCLWLSSRDVEAAIESWPPFRWSIIRFLCGRVREADQKLEAIVLQSTEAKLARFFLSAVEARPKGPKLGNVPLTLAISRSELGMLVGATPANVSAALSQLEASGIVTLKDSDIVCDPTGLRRIVGQGWD